MKEILWISMQKLSPFSPLAVRVYSYRGEERRFLLFFLGANRFDKKGMTGKADLCDRVYSVQ